MEKFYFKKKYGQNFLKDEVILDKICDVSHPGQNDLILEIGPGAGALTKRLKKYGAQVVSFEIDESTRPFLQPLEDERTKIIYTDFMEVDLGSVLSSYSYDKLYVIANLPYYITTPILEKIISSHIWPYEMVLMVQKEVAERFSAKPKSKEYGAFSVYLQYYFDVTTEFMVPKNAFYPAPKVDSAIVKLKRLERENLAKDENKFFQLVLHAFSHKRKTLRNNLSANEWEVAWKILESNSYSESVRAEEIPLALFIEIANAL